MVNAFESNVDRLRIELIVTLLLLMEESPQNLVEVRSEENAEPCQLAHAQFI